MKRSALIALLLCVLTLSLVLALSLMGGVPLAADDKAVRIAQVAQVAQVAPFDIRGADGVLPAATGQTETAGVPSSGATPMTTASLSADSSIGRYLLPMGNLRFSGERNIRAWNVFLTRDEASAAQDLRLTYINAIAVMPEVSRLTVFINDRQVFRSAIASSSSPRTVDIPLPEGLLHAGANVVRFEAEQRHRVVCSVAGTYELWTDIVAARTGFVFSPNSAIGQFQSVDELTAVGFDENGRTTLSVVVPEVLDTTVERQLLLLSQALALRGRFIHPVVQLPDTLPEESRPGELVVVMMQNHRLPRELASRLPLGSSHAIVDFVPLPDKSSALLITGGTAEDIDRAIQSIVPRFVADSASKPEVDMASFYYPEVPFISEGASIPLSQLGIESQEFSGRRFVTALRLALPADFYSEAYGEAQLLLDAGFATSLLHNSNFTVSVNGNTTVVQPIEVKAGDLWNQVPIRIPLRHFRPGLNTIELEGAFDTTEDGICAPGTTISNQPRFALFDSSRLIIPDFGHMGRTPDLAAFSARGFPYWHSADPMPVFLADRERDTAAAAATLVARVAFGAQRFATIDIVPNLNAIREQGALLVGAAGQMPVAVLSQVGLVQDLRAIWSQPSSTPDETVNLGLNDYDSVAERFRTRQSAAGAGDLREAWRRGGAAADADTVDHQGSERGFSGWIKETFDLTADDLLPSWKSTLYTPTSGASLILAQGVSPGGTGAWTVMTAGTPAMLSNAIAHLTRPELWSQVDGEITVFRMSSDTVKVIMPERTKFVPTRPAELFNLHRVAANWLSENLLAYALALFAVCILLGVSAYALLNQLGRR